MYILRIQFNIESYFYNYLNYKCILYKMGMYDEADAIN